MNGTSPASLTSGDKNDLGKVGGKADKKSSGVLAGIECKQEGGTEDEDACNSTRAGFASVFEVGEMAKRSCAAVRTSFRSAHRWRLSRH